MVYIWLNPVVESMYDLQSLHRLLESNGIHRITCNVDHASTVLSEYIQAIDNHPNKIVIDMRCPKASRELMNQVGRISGEICYFPEIEPILIHAARELSGRLGKDDICYVTTPCESLAELGRSIGLPGIVFLTWINFLKEHPSLSEALPGHTYLHESPIPPGFFKCITENWETVTGVEGIRSIINKIGTRNDKPSIIEMLYCIDGCHNGEGIDADR